jgi:acyl-CoA synthetase (AMP-forming)/AMP-acid ligase II
MCMCMCMCMWLACPPVNKHTGFTRSSLAALLFVCFCCQLPAAVCGPVSAHKQVSALEVERQLLEITGVLEAVVVAVPDPVWGSVIGAMLRLTNDAPTSRQHVMETVNDKAVFAKGACLLAEMCLHLSVASDVRLLLLLSAAEMKPRHVLFVSDVPKNAMGKVNKKALVSAFAPKE